jgi:hypothetical protein
MNGLRRQLLARAGFSCNKNGGLGRSDSFNDFFDYVNKKEQQELSI